MAVPETALRKNAAVIENRLTRDSHVPKNYQHQRKQKNRAKAHHKLKDFAVDFTKVLGNKSAVNFGQQSDGSYHQRQKSNAQQYSGTASNNLFQHVCQPSMAVRQEGLRNLKRDCAANNYEAYGSRTFRITDDKEKAEHSEGSDMFQDDDKPGFGLSQFRSPSVWG